VFIKIHFVQNIYKFITASFEVILRFGISCFPADFLYEKLALLTLSNRLTYWSSLNFINDIFAAKSLIYPISVRIFDIKLH